MPVDPGNLMMVGQARGQPILGAPGCARSPKENGFDWILMRLLAGLPVSRADITGLGVGGLLMEIVTRPQPREEAVAREGAPDRRRDPGRRPLDPHGRAEQAARRDRRTPAGSDRRGGGAGLARAARDRRHRPSAREGGSGAARPRRQARAQSELRRRAFHVGQDRSRRRAGGGRWRDRLPRRHAAGAGAADRQADRARSIPSAARWWSSRRSTASAAIRWSGRGVSSPN